MSLNNVWIEKYRPQTLDQMVLDASIRDKILKEKITGNILLIGPSGIGKTSIAKIICKNILECDYIYVNASDENGIDTIRYKITNFVQTKSIFNDKKVVILDEACGMSSNAQDALRNVMEEHLENVVFILTANYSHKIKPALKSRCKLFNLKYPLKEYVKHILEILKKEDISNIDKEVVAKIKEYYPDFRGCLNELEKNVVNGQLRFSENIENIDFTTQTWNNIRDLPIDQLRIFFIKNEDKFENDYLLLTRRLFNYVCYLEDLQPQLKSKILITLGEIIRTHLTVADVEINFFSKILEIKNYE